ncbi:hypothetical protein ACQRCQ_07025 [Lachnospiraceae bacterium SGI.085]
MHNIECVTSNIRNRFLFTVLQPNGMLPEDWDAPEGVYGKVRII